ncbi:MAG: SGNH/GDSL hydrolase family protein [Geobacteraceae bacterium]|nr:SGNH/GDSL hydrolase family protein [Geobacteraceae bacterium]
MNIKSKKNIAILISSFLLSLLLAETILRVIHVPHIIASGWSWHDSPRRFLATFRNDIPNEQGYRGQSIKYSKDDYVVVLLGDSQVEAATSSPEKMPERILEAYLSRRLNRSVKVFSLAASGWGQDQQLIALERYYQKYRADLVLVWATPGNDFRENAFPDYSVTSVAGHLKPTYRLLNNELTGPFYKSDFYYHSSALLQLLAAAYAKYKGTTVEQIILNDWIAYLPPSHELFNKVNLNESCSDLLPISQKQHSTELFTFKPDWKFKLLTHEDFYNSRSHYSPFLINRSPRDNYLVGITKKLYEHLNLTATKHNSEFKVFATDDDIDYPYHLTSVKCVQYLFHDSTARAVKVDSITLIKGIISADNLLIVDLHGGEELYVSTNDRHLSDIGNEKTMKNLAQLLTK